MSNKASEGNAGCVLLAIGVDCLLVREFMAGRLFTYDWRVLALAGGLNTLAVVITVVETIQFLDYIDGLSSAPPSKQQGPAERYLESSPALKVPKARKRFGRSRRKPFDIPADAIRLSAFAYLLPGTHAANVDSYYPDEHFGDSDVRRLRQLGSDVVTTEEAYMKQASDAEQLELAYGESRILITCDRDFLKLHRDGARHSGIVFAENNNKQAAIEACINLYERNAS